MGRQIESLEEFDKFKIKLGLENMQVLMKSSSQSFGL